MIEKRDGVAVEQMAIFEHRESQRARILSHLKEFGQCSLFTDFGNHIARLPARIADLQKEYNISSKRAKHYIGGVFAYNYAIYTLHEANK